MKNLLLEDVKSVTERIKSKTTNYHRELITRKLEKNGFVIERFDFDKDKHFTYDNHSFVEAIMGNCRYFFEVIQNRFNAYAPKEFVIVLNMIMNTETNENMIFDLLHIGFEDFDTRIIKYIGDFYTIQALKNEAEYYYNKSISIIRDDLSKMDGFVEYEHEQNDGTVMEVPGFVKVERFIKDNIRVQMVNEKFFYSVDNKNSQLKQEWTDMLNGMKELHNKRIIVSNGFNFYEVLEWVKTNAMDYSLHPFYMYKNKKVEFEEIRPFVEIKNIVLGFTNDKKLLDNHKQIMIKLSEHFSTTIIEIDYMSKKYQERIQTDSLVSYLETLKNEIQDI